MRRTLLLALAVAVALLVAFAVVTALEVPLMTAPQTVLGGGPTATVVAVALLIADVLIPVPSSLLMTWLGAAHGVVVGAALAWLGQVGAAALGFAIGRRGGPLVDRLVGAAERRRFDGLIARWGALAVIASRPVPIVAETVAILAGTSPAMSWRRFAAAAAAGAVPSALLYAIAGATAVDTGGALAVFAAALAVGAVAWLGGRLGAPVAGNEIDADSPSDRRGTDRPG